MRRPAQPLVHFRTRSAACSLTTTQPVFYRSANPRGETPRRSLRVWPALFALVAAAIDLFRNLLGLIRPQGRLTKTARRQSVGWRCRLGGVN